MNLVLRITPASDLVADFLLLIAQRGATAANQQDNIQHPTSNIQLPMQDRTAPCSTLDVERWALDILP
jgi:hypothetical protein